MSDEKEDDEGGDVWKDPPPGVREMLREARERPPMTEEEEDRAILRAQQGLARMRAKEAAARSRRRWMAGGVVIAVGVALGVGGGATLIAVHEHEGDEKDGRRAGAPRMTLDPEIPVAGQDGGVDAGARRRR